VVLGFSFFAVQFFLISICYAAFWRNNQVVVIKSQLWVCAVRTAV